MALDRIDLFAKEAAFHHTDDDLKRRTAMKREVAETTIKAMKEVDFAIDRLDKAVCQIEDEEERKKMLRFLANVIHDFHMKITLPVVQHFPDLHPDALTRANIE